jgi:SnoaL-like protein
MPWFPDLFSAPLLERIRSQSADARATEPVPYWDGVRSGETEALVGSFTGEPELHHPIRGRVKGRRGFERFVAETNAWLDEHNATWGSIERIITPRRGIEEAMLTVDSDQGRLDMPMAIAADRADDGRIIELRIYYSTWPRTKAHLNRPPVLQPPDADIDLPDVIASYQRALAAGDVDGVIAALEPDAWVREPAGDGYLHRGRDELVALYGRFFSNGGGIPLEHCAITDDGRACALEYNVVRWGETQLLPQAGIAVYVRGEGGKLRAVRIYDDVEPPLSAET